MGCLPRRRTSSSTDGAWYGQSAAFASTGKSGPETIRVPSARRGVPGLRRARVGARPCSSLSGGERRSWRLGVVIPRFQFADFERSSAAVWPPCRLISVNPHRPVRCSRSRSVMSIDDPSSVAPAFLFHIRTKLALIQFPGTTIRSYTQCVRKRGCTCEPP